MKKIIKYLFLAFFFAFFAENLSFAEDHLIPVIRNGKLGYIDTNGVKIAPQFDVDYETITIKFYKNKFERYRIPDYCWFSEGKAIVQKSYYFLFIWLYDKYQIIDTRGTVIIPPKFDKILSFNNGLAPVMKAKRTFFATYDGLWGYVRLNETLIQKTVADTLISKVTNKNEISYDTTINFRTILEKKFNDTLAIDTLYNFIGSFSDGFAWTIEKDSSIFFIDINGNKLNNIPYEQVWSFSEGLAAVKEKNVEPDALHRNANKSLDNQKKLFGYIDATGKYSINPAYQYAWSFHSGIARVFDGNYFFYIDKKGNKLRSGDFDAAEDFSDGMALVKIDNKCGFIDSTGSFAIEPQYANAHAFNEGVAAVFRNGKWGFIDKLNNWVIEPRFDFARVFRNGAAEVWIGEQYYLITKSGRIIWEFD